MKRKPVIWTLVILLVVLAVAGMGTYSLVPPATQPSQAAGEASAETAVARIGDLSVLASGTGQLIPVTETTLSFTESGTLTEILVNIGDQVSAGEVLARLRVNKSEAQRAAEIAEAELAVIEDQQTLEALYENAELKAAQALLDLENAQNTRADLRDYAGELAQALQNVAIAREAVEDAEMMLYINNSSASEDDIYTAYASLLFKEKKLNELKDELTHLKYEIKKAPDKAMRERIQGQIDRVTAQMFNQQVVYEEALYRYETIDDPADALDMKVALAQMDAAQEQLNQANLELAEAQLGAPAGDLALAEARVMEAQAAWEQWKYGPDPQEIERAETRLEASQLALTIARQEDLILDLIAPFDGTVMSIEAAVNQIVESGSLITLADTSQWLLEISLDESDFQSLQVGNRVEVIFDALPDTVFTGSIVRISPSLESTFGAQAIKALAVFEEPSLAKPISLPLGLNASVDVIAGEAHDAVLLPIEALHETSPENYLVYVLVNETFEPRSVTVGLMDFTSAEITSGLQAGEIVAIGEVEIK